MLNSMFERIRSISHTDNELNADKLKQLMSSRAFFAVNFDTVLAELIYSVKVNRLGIDSDISKENFVSTSNNSVGSIWWGDILNLLRWGSSNLHLLDIVVEQLHSLEALLRDFSCGVIFYTFTSSSFILGAERLIFHELFKMLSLANKSNQIAFIHIDDLSVLKTHKSAYIVDSTIENIKAWSNVGDNTLSYIVNQDWGTSVKSVNSNLRLADSLSSVFNDVRVLEGKSIVEPASFSYCSVYATA